MKTVNLVGTGVAGISAMVAVAAHGQIEVDPDFGTGRLIGKAAVPLLDGADDDEENTTKD